MWTEKTLENFISSKEVLFPSFMSARFRILALIPTLNEDPVKTVESILKQSIEVSKIMAIREAHVEQS